MIFHITPLSNIYTDLDFRRMVLEAIGWVLVDYTTAQTQFLFKLNSSEVIYLIVSCTMFPQDIRPHISQLQTSCTVYEGKKCSWDIFSSTIFHTSFRATNFNTRAQCCHEEVINIQSFQTIQLNKQNIKRMKINFNMDRF